MFIYSRSKHKQDKEKGYTLVEMCISMGLLSLFVILIGQIYVQLFYQAQRMKQQVSLSQEARTIELVIQDAIESASQVSIVTTEETIIPLQVKPNPSTQNTTTRPMVEINFVQEIKNGKSHFPQKGMIKLAANKKEGQGKYELIYKVKGKSTYNKIATQIDAIMITHTNDSNFIFVDYVLKQKKDNQMTCKFQKRFVVSLANKTPYV